MTESTVKFSNSTKDNRKGENVEGNLLAPAVIFNVHEIYERQQSFQKRLFKHQNIEESLNFLMSFQFGELAENEMEPQQLRFIIEDEFEAPNLNTVANIHRDKSIVLMFMKNDEKRYFIYWKMAEMDYFLRLKELNFIPDLDYKELYEFIGDFLLNPLSNNHIGVNENFEYSKKNSKIDIKDIADHQACNIFQNAAESGEVEVVKIIIQHQKMDFAKDMPNDPLSPQALALKNNFLDVFAILIKANHSYPWHMESTNFSDDIKQFIEAGASMHAAIKSKNEPQIQEIIKNNPNQKHFYNLRNESALKTALLLKCYKIYQFLLNNGVEFGPHEELFDFLTSRQKRNLTEFHFKHSKDLPDNYINILMINTTVSHYDNNNDDKEQFIKRAYEVLNQNPSTKIILEVVAASKKFEIVFDFQRDSVHMVDVSVTKDTKGVFHSCGKICVGAKQLLNSATEHETFGTLAHELCHHAMNLTYNNYSKPYKIDDGKRRQQFEDISSVYAGKKGDHIVEAVYEEDNYKPEDYHAELAVRAPHIIAQYHNQPEKLQKAQSEYPEMFNYYENFVVPEMKKALPKIRKKAEEMSSGKIIFICFIISIALMSLLSWFLYCSLYSPILKYEKLTPIEQFKVRNATVLYKGQREIISNLYPNDTKIYLKLESDHIARMLNGSILDFSDQKLFYLSDMIFFTWTNLTDKLRIKFLATNLTFQNQNLHFNNLTKCCQKTFNSLTSKEIIEILDAKSPLVIGSMKPLSAKFYIDRKFIPENSILVQLKFNDTKKQTFKEFFESYPKKNLKIESKTRWQSYSSHVANSVTKIKENEAISKLIGYEDFHKNLSDVISNAEHTRMFVLSSEAGAGKTVTFEHLAMELKQKYPNRWVSYVDLKDHRNLYDDKELRVGIEEFLEKILNLGTKTSIERKIFRDSFKSGNVVLLWNGFDEISPKYNDFILKITRYIQNNTNNIQYICTRPQYSILISDSLAIDAHMLVPFSESDQRIFLEKFFTSKNSTNTTAMVNKVLNLMKKIIYDDNRKFDNPLLLSMFAEIPDDIHENLNLYKIYDTFVAKKDTLIAQKGLTDKNLPSNSKFNLLRIFQQFSVKIDIFSFAFCTHSAITRLGIFANDPPDAVDFPEISRTGILYINNVTDFEFVHLTFAEFFIAQYLIDNVYKETSKEIKEEEFDSRLEMFFLIIQYSMSYERVIDFVRDYVRYDDKNTQFIKPIRDILKTKYKKHLIYILNKSYKHSFRFFFEFFKKDKELMLDMLKVYESETFFTALSNPFYMANNLDPEDVKNTVELYLTPEEFISFINGKHQRGVQLYGMFDRQDFANLSLKNFTVTSETQFWDFYGTIKLNLTLEERKQMFLNPIVTFIYRKHSTSNSTNEKFWLEVSELFKEQEMPIFIGNLFPQLFRPKLNISSDVEAHSLDMLITKTEELLSSDEIYEMALKTNLLFRSARSFPELQIIWNFLANHTSARERKELLKYDFRKSQSTEDQQFYSMYYKFFVMTPRVLHVNMFADNFTGSIDFVEKIYHETFKKSEILGFFNESNNFLFPLIFTRPIEACRKIASYLERLYGDEHKKELVELIERNFNDTGLSIFEYFDKILAFSFIDREDLRRNLKIFSDLRDKLKNSENN